MYPGVDEANIIYFKSYEEIINFIKRLISAKIIPIINYDEDFSTVIGYNKEGFWIVKSDPSQTDKEGRNFMTPAVPFEPIFVTNQQIFEKWRGIKYQFFWFDKTGLRTPESEIYLENKRNAQEAPQNIKAAIDYLKKGGDLLNYTFLFDIPSSIVLYRYFTKKGNTELANVYLEIAKTYDSLREEYYKRYGRPIEFLEKREFFVETLEKVQPLYEKAANLWP